MSTHAQRLIGVTILAASLSAVAPADVILEYDTGHPLGPHFLTLGDERPLEISVTDRTGEQWGIGAVLFDFVAPNGGLTWDLNGPDDTDFTADDGFVWQNGLGGFNDPNGLVCYFATVDPPWTVYSDFGGPDGAVLVPAHGTLLLASLLLAPTDLGNRVLRVGPDPKQKEIVFDVYTFMPMTIEDGTEEPTFTVLPRGDGDGDADVDLIDFRIFQACFTGSEPSDVQGVCTLFDFDSDDDIDLDDFAEFQKAVKGA